jgi:hypothetical protein
MRVWPGAPAGLREIRRVLRGAAASCFTPASWQPRTGLTETLSAAGFEAARLAHLRGGFCPLARRPG